MTVGKPAKPAVKPTDETMFLVRIDSSHYFVYADGNEISATEVLSCAQHLTYRQADLLCQALVKRRHRGAVVTDHLGVPVTHAMLRAFEESESVTAV